MLSPLDVLDDAREDFLSVVPMPDGRARERGSDMVLRGHPWIRERILPDWTWHDRDNGSTFSMSNSADQESGIDHRLAAHHPVSGEALIKVTIEKL